MCISQNLQQEAQSVQWEERVTSGHVCCRVSFVFLRGFYFNVSTTRYVQLQLFLYKISSDLVGNLLRTELYKNSSHDIRLAADKWQA